MTVRLERRHHCDRIIGVERRGAPIQSLEGNPLPDPTRLVDEDFAESGLEALSIREPRTGADEDKGH
jgi:hypothetical protein